MPRTFRRGPLELERPIRSLLARLATRAVTAGAGWPSRCPERSGREGAPLRAGADIHAGLRRADRERFFIPRAQRRAGFVASEPRRKASTIPPSRPAEGRRRAASRSNTDR